MLNSRYAAPRWLPKALAQTGEGSAMDIPAARGAGVYRICRYSIRRLLSEPQKQLRRCPLKGKRRKLNGVRGGSGVELLGRLDAG